jgi:hypothetical protein
MERKEKERKGKERRAIFKEFIRTELLYHQVNQAEISKQYQIVSMI